jgi:hypothetical protein
VKADAKDALGDHVLDLMEGTKKRNYSEAADANTQSSSSSTFDVIRQTVAFRLENKVPVEQTASAVVKRSKAPLPSQGILLSVDQVSDRYPGTKDKIEECEADDQYEDWDDDEDIEV